jgi:hypothetical protein
MIVGWCSLKHDAVSCSEVLSRAMAASNVVSLMAEHRRSRPGASKAWPGDDGEADAVEQ